MRSFAASGSITEIPVMTLTWPESVVIGPGKVIVGG